MVAAPLVWAISRPADIPFQKQQIDLGAAETAAVADVNGDGKLDIISGEYWYAAPNWERHKFRELPYSNGYVDNFSDLPIDVDGDGRIDIVSCSWFRKSLRWWRNPGVQGTWKEHSIQEGYPIEFAFLVDLDNDKKANEILPEFGDVRAPLAWYEAKIHVGDCTAIDAYCTLAQQSSGFAGRGSEPQLFHQLAYPEGLAQLKHRDVVWGFAALEFTFKIA